MQQLHMQRNARLEAVAFLIPQSHKLLLAQASVVLQGYRLQQHLLVPLYQCSQRAQACNFSCSSMQHSRSAQAVLDRLGQQLQQTDRGAAGRCSLQTRQLRC